MTAVRRRVGFLAGVILAIFAVGAGWFHARDQQARLQRAAAVLQNLDAAEWRFNETILRLRYGLLNNYDGANEILAALRNGRVALQRRYGNADPMSSEAWRAYDRASRLREEDFERFKFEAAVIRNSVQYFAGNDDHVFTRYPETKRRAALLNEISDLSEAVMRMALAAQPGLEEEIGLRMGRLAPFADDMSAAVADDLRRLLRHAAIVRHRQPRLENLTHALIQSPARDDLDRLIVLNRDQVRAEIAAEARTRGVLVTLAALMAAGLAVAAGYYRRERESAQAGRRLVASLTEQAGVGMIACDADGRIVFANPYACIHTGWSAGELVGQSLHDRLHVGTDGRNEGPIVAALRDGNGYSGETEFRRRDEGRFPVELSLRPAAGPDRVAAVIVFQDITDRRGRERERRLAETVFRTSQQGIVITDGSGTIQRVNQAYCAATGYTEQELVGANPRLLKSGQQGPDFYQAMWAQLLDTGRWEGEIRNRRKNGDIYVQWARIQGTRSDEGLHYVGVVSDITEQLLAREGMERMTYYDPLTRLPNRVLFLDRLRQAILQARRTQRALGLALIDLDHFKNVNDTLGHASGDQVLAQVGQRLADIAGETDTAARLGGDEFALLLPDRRGPEELARVAETVVAELGQPVPVNGSEYRGGASVGITVYPYDADNAEQLLRHAEVAMYRAKERGRGRFQFFVREMAETVVAYMRIEVGLRQAIEQKALALHFQPVFRMPDRKLVGAEALVRWNSPELGPVPPSQFIPVAESSGLIASLDGWVLEAACRQAAAWQARHPGFRMAVNFSAPRFNQDGVAGDVRRILERTGLDGSRLELEITERVMLGGGEQARLVMEELKGLGCRLAIDDFGTGYSSLSYLRRLPVDTLKIDKSFVDGLGTTDPAGGNDRAVVATIIGLARNLRLHVVAEGVETESQLAVLGEFIPEVCEMAIQGFLLGRPVPPDEFADRYLAGAAT